MTGINPNTSIITSVKDENIPLKRQSKTNRRKETFCKYNDVNSKAIAERGHKLRKERMNL